jgi:hypothetical protein
MRWEPCRRFHCRWSPSTAFSAVLHVRSPAPGYVVCASWLTAIREFAEIASSGEQADDLKEARAAPEQSRGGPVN